MGLLVDACANLLYCGNRYAQPIRRLMDFTKNAEVIFINISIDFKHSGQAK